MESKMDKVYCEYCKFGPQGPVNEYRTYICGKIILFKSTKHEDWFSPTHLRLEAAKERCSTKNMRNNCKDFEMRLQIKSQSFWQKIKKTLKGGVPSDQCQR